MNLGHENEKKLVKNLVFGLLFTFFVSACGRGFHTFYVDTDAPTSSNPLEADLLDISKIDSEERLAFCEKAGLNGFSSLKNKEFICSLLPSAIRLNQRVYKQRLQTQTLLEKSQNSSLSSAETEWLARLKTSYKLNEDATLTELLISVDVVPLSLLMAQAALESGWGTSRFAVEGKNFFGISGSAKTDQCQWAGENKNICGKKYNSKIEGLADYIKL